MNLVLAQKVNMFKELAARASRQGRSRIWGAGVALLVAATAPTINAQTVPFTPLYLFQGGTDGYTPTTPFQGIDKNIYGTTAFGGASGNGTVFQLTSGGALTTLHTFNYTDGNDPSILMQASDGNFYGVATFGGATGVGTFYQLNSSDDLLTTLYAFTGASEGANPGDLVQGYDGNFYVVADTGGLYINNCSDGCGVVNKLTPDGKLTTL